MSSKKLGFQMSSAEAVNAKIEKADRLTKEELLVWEMIFDIDDYLDINADAGIRLERCRFEKRHGKQLKIKFKK